MIWRGSGEMERLLITAELYKLLILIMSDNSNYGEHVENRREHAETVSACSLYDTAGILRIND